MFWAHSLCPVVDISCSASNILSVYYFNHPLRKEWHIYCTFFGVLEEIKIKRQSIKEVASHVSQSTRVFKHFLFLCGRFLRLDTKAQKGRTNCRETVQGGDETKTFDSRFLVVEFTFLHGYWQFQDKSCVSHIIHDIQVTCPLIRSPRTK